MKPQTEVNREYIEQDHIKRQQEPPMQKRTKKQIKRPFRLLRLFNNLLDLRRELHHVSPCHHGDGEGVKGDIADQERDGCHERPDIAEVAEGLEPEVDHGGDEAVE